MTIKALCRVYKGKVLLVFRRIRKNLLYFNNDNVIIICCNYNH